MAEFDFLEFTSKEDKGSSAKVKYFNTLKNDGDETLVRFNYDSSSDFKVVSVHRVESDGKFLSVSCLRDMYEKKDEKCSCPFCRNGNKYPVKIKTYVQMIEYTKDENGNVVANPVVWERGSGIVNDILGAFNDGVTNALFPKDTPLRDVVFKIRRQGKAHSTDTRFVISAGNPIMYPDTVYTKDFSSLEGYDASKHVYWVKTADEINRFLETGSFKEKEESKEDGSVSKAAPAVEEPAPIPETPVEEAAPAPQPTPQAAPRRVQL